MGAPQLAKLVKGDVDAGKAGWVVDKELLLGHAVEAFRLQDLPGLESVIENPVAAPNDNFRRSTPAAHSPGETQSRGPVAVVVDGVLGFEAEAAAERDIGLQAPVVLYVQSRSRSR